MQIWRNKWTWHKRRTTVSTHDALTDSILLSEPLRSASYTEHSKLLQLCDSLCVCVCVCVSSWYFEISSHNCWSMNSPASCFTTCPVIECLIGKKHTHCCCTHTHTHTARWISMPTHTSTHVHTHKHAYKQFLLRSHTHELKQINTHVHTLQSSKGRRKHN